MAKVAVMADSNCGITQCEAKEHGIDILPMPVIVDGEEYFEDVSITYEEFYKKIAGGASVSTSQPSPGALMEHWDALLKEYDEIVYIPMSSGLSESCRSAMTFAQEYNGKVVVVDNHRISVTERLSVLQAKKLADEGKSALEIRDVLLKDAFKAMIYITCDDLQYLKRGGRLTPSVAAIGTLLNIKPVLKIDGYKLDTFSKTRGMKAARKTMVTAAKEYSENELKDITEAGELQVCVAYTDVPEETLNEWVEQVREQFPDQKIIVNPLTLCIACHIGPGALALTVSGKA